MARIRSIKPELATKKKLASISREARYTFVLLLTQADDEGFLLAEPRQLLGTLYPHDDDVTPERLDGWLGELVAIGSIVFRLTLDGSRVVQVVGWHEHQRVKNPAKSKIEPTLTPVLRSSSVEPPEDVGTVSPLEVGSRKGEVGSRKEEVGSAGDDLGGDGGEGLGSVAVPTDWPPASDHRGAALRGAIRAARNPVSLLAELRAVHSGMHGPPADWLTIGQAVHEMQVAGAAMSSRALRAFVRDLQRPKLEPPSGDAPVLDLAALREREIARLRGETVGVVA